MIIVTGMDNTGKTTLAKQLAEEMKLKIVKSPGPKITKEEQREWVLNQITGADERQAIHERFPLFEELVYGKVLREPNFGYGDSYFKLLKQVNPLIVYTRPSNQSIFNFGEREQMKGVIEESEKLLAAYDELMFKLISDGWRVIPYNYELNEPEEIMLAYNISKMMEGVVMLHG